MSDSTRVEKTRACASCSRAKAKCVWLFTSGDETDICQRNSKAIEQKLDDIMILLSRERERSGAAVADRPTPILRTMYQEHPPIPSTQPLDVLFPPRSGFIDIVPGFQISFSEADQVIQEYMTAMLPEFPFVPLPLHSSYDMYKDKPLLLKTILWVCRPPDSEAFAAFESWFRNHVAHQTVVLVNKSLELLQAILVFLAWRDIYFYASSKDTSLLHLAVGLVEDLGLNKPRCAVNPTFGSIVEDAAQLRNDLPPQPKQTADGHRAVLGVYYITSTLCSLLGRRSRLEYTSHFDSCCKQLIGDHEYPTDLLLVNLVRVRQIAIKVHDAFWESAGVANHRSPNFHAIAIASIQNELDAFLKQLPDHLKWNHLLRTHCAAVNIRLYEPVGHSQKSDPSDPTQVRWHTMLDCLESTQTLWDTFRLVPVESYHSLAFVSILHLALAIIKALRLLCVEDGAWDLETARTTYNLPDILRQLNKLFETASNLGNPRCKIIVHGRPIFSDYAEAYRNIEGWYSSKLNPGGTHSSSTVVEPALAHSGEQYEGFEFWNQLSDLTYGLAPYHSSGFGNQAC